MRQALNNLQSTHEGFGFVKSENVFKVHGGPAIEPPNVYLSLFQVCDEPHPLLVKDMLDHATRADIDQAYKILAHLWELGYSPEDIITNVFRVCKSHNMAEFLKLEFIKEIGRTHLAMAQGTSSLLQVPSIQYQYLINLTNCSFLECWLASARSHSLGSEIKILNPPTSISLF